MIRKTLLISAAILALAGCDNAPLGLGQGSEAEAGANTPEAKQLREALREAPSHGLTTDLFIKGELDSAGEADLRDAVLSLASALAKGKVDPAKLGEPYTLPRPPNAELDVGFEKALIENQLVEWLSSLAPQTDEYRKLSLAFRQFVALAANTPDTNIPAGEPIKQGSSDPRVPDVIKALRAGGYMPAPPRQRERQSQQQATQPAAQYTAEVAAAVRRMQQDFGLKPDGVIGKDTLKAVNTSARDRARQLAVAMERLRWLERRAPATRIDVNTAAASLRYWRDGALADERRVVVGQPDWKTPQLGSPMYRLVANPTWTVPRSIEDDELSKKSAAYLRDQGIVRKDGWLVQEPGPKNALGQVKFDMKNGEAIYLHDTPAKALFASNQRHESHGCVRVHNALEFARLLAQADGALDQFEEAMASGEETSVDLKTDIPVRLMYQTAYLGSDGKVHFAEDVYGWDNEVAAALGYERREVKQRQRRGSDFGP